MANDRFVNSGLDFYDTTGKLRMDRERGSAQYAHETDSNKFIDSPLKNEGRQLRDIHSAL